MVNRANSVYVVDSKIVKPDFKVIKLYACLAQLSMKFILLINVKMLAFLKCWHFNIYKQDKRLAFMT